MLLAVLGLAAAAASPTMVTVAPDESLSVLVSGPPDGDAVVCVPGLSGCAYGFRHLEEPLHGRGVRTVMIEPLGLGLSDRPRGADYTLTAQAARLGAALDALQVPRAVFVSQGVATSMVLRLALARPELVAGIVSIEGGAAETAATRTVTAQLDRAKLVAKLGGDKVLRDRFAADLAAASGDDRWLDRRTLNHYFRGPQRDLAASLEVLRAMATQPEPAPLEPRLGDVAAPVIVLCGTAAHEGALEPNELVFLAQSLPDVRFVDVPNAGHFIQEECPTAVLQAVVELVDRARAAPR